MQPTQKRHLTGDRTFFLCIVYSKQQRASDIFTVNGNKIDVPSPKPFVRVTGEMTAEKKVDRARADSIGTR